MNNDSTDNTDSQPCHAGEPVAAQDTLNAPNCPVEFSAIPMSFLRKCVGRNKRRSTVTRLFAAAWYRWGLLLRRCERNGRMGLLGEAEAGSAGKQPAEE